MWQLLPNKKQIATVLHSISGPNFGSRIWYLNKPSHGSLDANDLRWMDLCIDNEDSKASIFCWQSGLVKQSWCIRVASGSLQGSRKLDSESVLVVQAGPVRRLPRCCGCARSLQGSRKLDCESACVIQAGPVAEMLWLCRLLELTDSYLGLV
jgi:hypothetical protein